MGVLRRDLYLFELVGLFLCNVYGVIIWFVMVSGYLLVFSNVVWWIKGIEWWGVESIGFWNWLEVLGLFLLNFCLWWC